MVEVFNIFVYVWYAIFFILITILFFQNSLEYKSKYKNDKIAMSPKINGPHLLSMLLYRKITNNVISSTLLILIKKEIIKVSEEKGQITFTDNSAGKNTSFAQKYLIEMLFKIIGSDGKFTIEEIAEASKNSGKCSMFLTDMQILKKILLKEAANNKYYEEKKTYLVINIYKNITFSILIANFILKINSFNGYFIIIPAYFLLFSFYHTYKRTTVANDEYHKWMSFKKEILTTSNDQYLIEAIMLNISGVYAKNTNQDEKIAYILHTQISKLIRRSILYGNRGYNAGRNK